MHAQMLREGIGCSDELVRLIMVENGLIACQPRPWRTVGLTESDGREHPIADLLEQNFTADRPGTNAT